MGNDNLVVLICRDYDGHPETLTKVCSVEEATKLLDEMDLYLSINPAKKRWKLINKEDGRSTIKASVGNSRDFNKQGLQLEKYTVGVYNSSNIKHIQEIVEQVQYKEDSRRTNTYEID